MRPRSTGTSGASGILKSSASSTGCPAPTPTQWRAESVRSNKIWSFLLTLWCQIEERSLNRCTIGVTILQTGLSPGLINISEPRVQLKKPSVSSPRVPLHTLPPHHARPRVVGEHALQPLRSLRCAIGQDHLPGMDGVADAYTA